MNDSSPVGSTDLQIEYLDDIAVVNTAGDLKGAPADMFRDATRLVLAKGFRLLLFDFYDNEGLDEDGIADYLAAILDITSFEEQAEFAIVPHRGTQEWESRMLINWNLFVRGRSFYSREEALAHLRGMTQKREKRESRWWRSLLGR